jgi:hypothetical protein
LQFSLTKPLAKYYLKDEDEYEIRPYDLSSSPRRSKTMNPYYQIYQTYHLNQLALKQLAS